MPLTIILDDITVEELKRSLTLMKAFKGPGPRVIPLHATSYGVERENFRNLCEMIVYRAIAAKT